MKLKTLFYLLFYSILIQLFIGCDNSKTNSIYLNPNQKDSIILKQLLFDANEFIEKNNPDSSKYFASKLLELASVSQNHFYLGKGHAIYGYCYLINQKNDSAYYHLNKAKENFIKINDSLNTGKNLTNMAIIQSNEGDYVGAEQIIIESLNFLNNESNNSKLSLYNSLAITSRKQHDYEEAVYWYHKSLSITKDDLNKRLCLNNLAISYRYLENYKKSDSILSILLKDTIVKKNPDLKSKIIDNLAYSKWKQNPQSVVENEFKNALAIRIENNDKWGQIASNSHLSEYFSQKNPITSLFHANEMYRLATELKSPDDRLEALQKLISLESPENSKKYAIRYASLSDSLITERNRAKDKFAKIRYDSEKNREDNENLKAETAEQKLEIERRKLYGVLFISGIVLICGGFLAFHRIQKIKNQQKINEEIYAAENKIAAKVHDDVANNVYGLIAFIEGNEDSFNPEKQNVVLEKLDEIYQLSRNISRENSPIETGEKYPDELMNLFSNYKNEITNLVLIGFVKDPWINVKSETKIQFYKVVQELLTNMKKHSEATLVVLTFKFEENKLDFFYVDNGIGFSDNQLINQNGIQITENRIEKIKGTISFASEPNKGLKVNINVPI